jgi:peptidoglycan hydrolase-like protein with peptidoglycan-binding domain
MDEGRPRAGLKYQLEIAGRLLKGKTDGDGVLDVYVPPDAAAGTLKLGDPPEEILEVQFGYLDPISNVAGLQKRLNNLGFDCGGEDGDMNEGTRQALEDFQRRVKLPVTGEADEATLAKLQELHDRTEEFPAAEK